MMWNNFTFAANHYQAAWKAVCERYDDKRKIANYHLDQLFNVKKMANERSIELATH